MRSAVRNPIEVRKPTVKLSSSSTTTTNIRKQA